MGHHALMSENEVHNPLSLLETNVFITEPIIEPEKLSVYGSLVGPMVELVTS